MGPAHEDEHFICDFSGKGFLEGGGSPLGIEQYQSLEIDVSIREHSSHSEKSVRFTAPTQLSAFLAHPITGLDEDQSERVDEISHCIVTTIDRCVDPPFVWYDPADTFDPQATDQSATYASDFERLFWSDILVVNRLCPADGVGMLVQKAGTMHIPTLVLYPGGADISPMYLGMPSAPKCQSYESTHDLQEMLPEVIQAMLPRIRQRHGFQRDIGAAVSSRIPGKAILAQRLLGQKTLRTMADETGYCESFLYRLEVDSTFLLMLPPLGQASIFSALDVKVSQLWSEGFALKVHSEAIPPFVRASLENLSSYYVDAFGTQDYAAARDSALVRTWVLYDEQCNSLATRDRKAGASFQAVITEQEWQDRLNENLTKLI